MRQPDELPITNILSIMVLGNDGFFYGNDGTDLVALLRAWQIDCNWSGSIATNSAPVTEGQIAPARGEFG